MFLCEFCHGELIEPSEGYGILSDAHKRYDCEKCLSKIDRVLLDGFYSKYMIYINIIDNKIIEKHIIIDYTLTYVNYTSSTTSVYEYVKNDNEGPLSWDLEPIISFSGDFNPIYDEFIDDVKIWKVFK